MLIKENRFFTPNDLSFFLKSHFPFLIALFWHIFFLYPLLFHFYFSINQVVLILESIIKALINYTVSLIECEDYRTKNGFKIMNQVSFFPMKAFYYSLPNTIISQANLISDLQNEGWEVGYRHFYNTIMIHENKKKFTLMIPNTDEIAGLVHHTIKKWSYGSDKSEGRMKDHLGLGPTDDFNNF